MDAGVVQIIVAVIGISGPIVLEYIRLRKTSSSETTEQQPVGTSTQKNLSLLKQLVSKAIKSEIFWIYRSSCCMEHSLAQLSLILC